MYREEIKFGGAYVMRVSGKMTVVEVYGLRRRGYGGFDVVNLRTGRSIYLRSARRIQREATSDEKRQALAH